jgi:MFS family permease
VGARTGVVNAAGAVQGIVLVTAPAASTVFTSPTGYGLSSAQYGAMFVPQVVTAILAARLGPRLPLRTAYLGGLAAGLVGMALLALSALAHQGTAYGLLLAATAFIGAGFGLTVPAINSLTAAFHPGNPDTAVLVLNALLGLGTALAPVFVAVFVGLGFWWGLPLLSGVLLAVLLVASSGVSAPSSSSSSRVSDRLPRGFWVVGAFGVLYGICETTNGNWAQLDLTTDVGTTAAVASVGLTAFWAMVTVGRVGFATLEHVIPPQWTYRVLPLALAAVFVLIASVPRGATGLGVLSFGLAGLCCSALLPLTISFGQAAFPAAATAVSGGVIAAYQLGYGLAAFGVGPLRTAGVALPTIYAGAAVVALVMAGLAIPVSRSRSRVG